MPDERLVTANRVDDDAQYESGLRPRTLDEYIGQDKIRENLHVAITAARQRGEALDHVLLYGPPGLGKTTLAHVIANELGVAMRPTAGPVIERPGDLAALVSNLQARDVLFIDEVHRMSPTIEETLYPAMEDYHLDIVIGEGPGARAIKLAVEPFTLIGATTRTGLLTSPLRARFGIVLRLDYYTEQDILEIVLRSARILGVEIERDAAGELAGRSRGTPRVANRLLRRVRDYAQVRADGRITRRNRSPAAADDHREVQRRAGWRRQPGCRPQRGTRRHRGHLRAVSHSDWLSRADAARARSDAAGVRVLRTDQSGKGQIVVMRRVRIAGLSTYVPPRVLTNADLERLVETNDEWILQRTGIRERHIVSDGMATSDMAMEAALGAIAPAGITPADIGFIVVGTTTPDTIFPSTACVLQDKIGATRSWGFDLGAACSGFTYSLTVGMQMVATGAHDHALVVGADTMSSIIDYRDRTTCILFGDGAGAAVLSPAGDDEPAIIDFAHEIDGSGGPALCMPAGGSRMPASHETIDARQHYVKQDGQTVFKFAVRKTEEISRRVLERNGLQPSDVDLFVSHQANRRIIKAAAERLGLPDEKVVINLERFGNTTGATIPLALADAVADKRLKRGELVLLASVGAGFTVGAVLLRWGY